MLAKIEGTGDGCKKAEKKGRERLYLGLLEGSHELRIEALGSSRWRERITDVAREKTHEATEGSPLRRVDDRGYAHLHSRGLLPHPTIEFIALQHRLGLAFYVLEAL